MEPLHWPDQLQQHAQKPPLWHRLPLVGLYKPPNFSRAIEPVAEQLKTRQPPPPEVWGDDPARVNVAHYLCSAAQKRYQWPNDHFIPEDPFDVVFQIPFDDLEIVEMVLRFEEELKITISDEEAQQWADKTLGEVVDFLLRKTQKMDVDCP